MNLFHSFPLFVFLLFGAQSFAQSLRIEHADAIAADNLKSVYVVTGEKLTKYNEQLEPQRNYFSTFGAIESVDVSDPFKIVVFCKNFTRIVLLDNQLSPLGLPIFLPDVEVFQPCAVAASLPNALWIVDAYRQKVLYYNFALNTLRNVASLDVAAPPNFAIERAGKLYLNFAGKHIEVYDKFGARLATLRVENEKWLEVQHTTLYYLRNQTLLSNSALLPAEAQTLATEVKACAIVDQTLWLYARDTLQKILLK